ncbi:MAG: reverse transcriptase-like protein [bacterium]
MAQWIQEGGWWPWLALLLGMALLVWILVLLMEQRRWVKDIRAEMGEVKWLCQQAMDLVSWQDRSRSWGGPMESAGQEEEILDLRRGKPMQVFSASSSSEGDAGSKAPAPVPERDGGRAFVWAAGFSKGPQGPACFGAVVKNSRGEVLARLQEKVGKLDRRNAMYQGVTEALYKVKQCGIEKVVVFTSPIGGPKGSRGPQNLPGIEDSIRKRLEEVRSQFVQFEWVIVEPPKNREAESLAREGLMSTSKKKG